MRNNLVHDKNYAVAGNVTGTPFTAIGGTYVMGAFGTFGGGAVTLQQTTDTDVTWFDCGPQDTVPTTLTAAGSAEFSLAPGRYRVNVTGTTAPALNYYIGEANQSS